MGFGGRRGGRGHRSHRSHHRTNRTVHRTVRSGIHSSLGRNRQTRIGGITRIGGSRNTHRLGNHSHVHVSSSGGGGGICCESSDEACCCCDAEDMANVSPDVCCTKFFVRPRTRLRATIGYALIATEVILTIMFFAGLGVVFSPDRTPSYENLPPIEGYNLTDTTCRVASSGHQTVSEAGVGEHKGCWAVQVEFPPSAEETPSNTRILVASLTPPPQSPTPPCDAFVGKEFPCVYAKSGVWDNASIATVCPGDSQVCV